MKKILQKTFQTVLLLALMQSVYGQTPYANFTWAVKAGGIQQEFASQSIAIDAEKNTYIAGYFQGSATFGSTTLTATAGYNFYIAKLNPQGQFLWAKKGDVSDSGQDFSMYIDVDGQGNSYISGNFRGSATFGSTTLTAASSATDLFFVKLDAQGEFVWVRHAVGQQYNWAVTKSIAADQAGNTYVTGVFKYGYSVAFGSTVLTGDDDGFVAKLDPQGQFVWIAKMDGVSGGNGFSMEIDVDADGNSYVTGDFYNTATFGSIALSSPNYRDVFVTKLNAQGQFVWATQAGGTYYSGDTGNGIAVDAAGNSYITGEFFETATFGNTTLTSAGQRDIFVAKVDTQGQFLWATKAGGTNHDYGYDIVVDASGNAYVSGYVSSQEVAFGGNVITVPGGYKAYVAQVNSQGQFIGSALVDETNIAAIGLDNDGVGYITGVLGGPSDFGSTTLTQSGGGDIYVAKMTANPLSVKEVFAGSVAVYPNPGSGVFTVESAQLSGAMEIKVYSISGRLVIEKTLSGEDLSIDISNQPSGVYIMQLNAQNTVHNYKIVKQ